MKANWSWNLEVAADQVEHLAGYRAIRCFPGPWVSGLCRSNLVVGIRLPWIRPHRRLSSWLDENLLVASVHEIAWVYQMHCSYQSFESRLIGLSVDMPW